MRWAWVMLGNVVGLEMAFGCIQDRPEMGRVSFFTLAACYWGSRVNGR